MDIVSSGRPGSPARGAAERGRVDWVDVAKGICIILVVMMHTTLGVGDAMGREGFMHAVVAFAKPFRMPDFFLISGLFLSRVIDRDWRSYGDRRVLHFAYFYLLWLVIQSGFKYGQLSGGSPAGFAEHLLRSLVDPFSTLWFIYMLAIFSIVTKLLRPVSPAILLAAAAALQIMPIETHSFLLNEFCERWVFFLLGYYGAPRVFALSAAAARHPSGALASLVVWAVVNGVLAATPSPVGRAETLAELPGIGLALGLSGALAIVVAATVLSRFRAAEALRYCGRNSICIYLAFFLPMAATREALIASGLIDDAGLVSLVTLLVAVAAPLLLERAVRHSPLAFLFRRPEAFRLGPAPRRPFMQPAE